MDGCLCAISACMACGCRTGGADAGVVGSAGSGVAIMAASDDTDGLSDAPADDGSDSGEGDRAGSLGRARGFTGGGALVLLLRGGAVGRAPTLAVRSVRGGRPFAAAAAAAAAVVVVDDDDAAAAAADVDNVVDVLLRRSKPGDLAGDVAGMLNCVTLGERSERGESLPLLGLLRAAVERLTKNVFDPISDYYFFFLFFSSS